MPCACIEATCPWLSRTASSPPWMAGCSVLTRPSIISGNPVDFGHVEHFEARICERPGGAAGRDEFDTVPRQRAGELDEADLVGNRDESASDRTEGDRSWSNRFVLLLAAVASHDPDRRCGRERESPLHPRDLAGMAVDDDLRGAPRSLCSGKGRSFPRSRPDPHRR